MKKSILLLFTISMLCLSACGKKASPIVLPKPEQIQSIETTANGSTTTYTDAEQIQSIISGFLESEPTDIESVQDAPQGKDYVKIEIWQEAGGSTLFAYEENGIPYIEQPYQGIYKITPAQYEQLTE